MEEKKKQKGKSWGGKSLEGEASNTPIDNNVGTTIYQWKDGFTTTVSYGKGPTRKIDWSKRGL